jgi:hypothetical protein
VNIESPSLQVAWLDPKVAAHRPKKARAEFLLRVLEDSRIRFEPDTPMTAFAETGIVLKAKAAVAG